MNLLTMSYWTNLRPEALSPLGLKVFVILLGGFAVLAFLIKILKGNKRGLYYKIWQNLLSFFLTNFFIGLVLLFFSYESIPFLAARIWLLVWLLSMLAWLGFIIKFLLKIPNIKQEKSKEREYNKYIP